MNALVFVKIWRQACSCCSRPKKKGVRVGGAAEVSAVVSSLRAQPDDPTAIHRFCTILKGLSVNRGNQVIAVRDGVLPVLVTLLRTPHLEKHSPLMLPLICELISSFVDENPDHQTAAAQAFVIEALLDVVATARDSDALHASSIATAGCKALWATIFDFPPNQELAVRKGAIPVMVALLLPSNTRPVRTSAAATTPSSDDIVGEQTKE